MLPVFQFSNINPDRVIFLKHSCEHATSPAPLPLTLLQKLLSCHSNKNGLLKKFLSFWFYLSTHPNTSAKTHWAVPWHPGLLLIFSPSSPCSPVFTLTPKPSLSINTFFIFLFFFLVLKTQFFEQLHQRFPGAHGCKEPFPSLNLKWLRHKSPLSISLMAHYPLNP